ncbi:MAG TPA: chromate transporter [Chloroflexota bacterium]|jgi:chromate transporter
MTLGQMLVQLLVANMLTFGNGTVMAGILQQSFVQQAHAITNDQLLYAFAVARVTPGQANLYVASIAYMMFGLPGSVLSILVIALPSYLMIPLLHSYEFLRGNRLVLNMTRGLGATAVGLLLATTWNLAKDSMSAPVTWVVLAVGLALLLFTRLPTLVSLLAATGAGVVLVVGAGLVS